MAHTTHRTEDPKSYVDTQFLSRALCNENVREAQRSGKSHTNTHFSHKHTLLSFAKPKIIFLETHNFSADM